MNIEKIIAEFEEKYRDEDFDSNYTGNISREKITEWLRTTLQSLGKHIVEEMEKRKKVCPNHREDDAVECYGYDENFNSSKDEEIAAIKKTFQLEDK